MKIAIASDHAGYDLKITIIDYLKKNNYEIDDFGAFSNQSVDYPDYAYPAAISISKGLNDFGVFICGSGVGVSISANKVEKIRAVNAWSPEIAELSRKHNNCNVLCLGSRFLSLTESIEIINVFLRTPFDFGRHEVRVNKLILKTTC